MREMLVAESQPLGYTEVRGLTRGLKVLRVLNSLAGGMGSTSEVASLCQLHRTTVKRLLETMCRDGIVRHGDRDGQYCLTFEVRRLAEGFVDEAWVCQVATAQMRASVRTMRWPCDIATVDAGFMVVRESTHRWSTLSQHRAMVGERLPLFVTSLGRAWLSHCDSAERDATLALLCGRGDWIGDYARDRSRVAALIADTVSRGFAVNDVKGPRDTRFSSIAVPVFAGSHLLASLNMVFPRDAVSGDDIDRRYAPALKQLSTTIGNLSRSWVEA